MDTHSPGTFPGLPIEMDARTLVHVLHRRGQQQSSIARGNTSQRRRADCRSVVVRWQTLLASATVSCLESYATDPVFHTDMVHLYRGEMHRMVTWRTRLDTTTYWAILLTTGLTTFTLGSASTPHYLLLLALALDLMVMLIEARRYRQLHHSRWRVQLLERNFFAQQLHPRGGCPEPNWREQLAADLAHPHLTVGLFVAMCLRLRRNYVMLLYFVTGVWLTKLYIHPTNAHSLSEIYERLAMSYLLPSWLVAGVALAFVVAISSLVLSSPSEEELDARARR
jgi:uncharacterized membrane protein